MIKYKYYISLLYLLILTHYILSEIINGECILSSGQGINFSSHSDSVFIRTSSIFYNDCGTDYSSCCNEVIFDSVDLSYSDRYGHWDIFGCCSGNVTGFRSNDTIWTISNISSLNFHNELRLNDTSYFNLAMKKDSCKTWVMKTYAEISDCNPCRFTNPVPEDWMLLKINEDNFIIINILWQAYCWVQYSEEDVFCTKISWWLQTNGTLDFSKCSFVSSISNYNHSSTLRIRNNQNMKVIIYDKKKTYGNNVFDLRGRRINREYSKKSFQVLLIDNNEND